MEVEKAASRSGWAGRSDWFIDCHVSLQEPRHVSRWNCWITPITEASIKTEISVASDTKERALIMKSTMSGSKSIPFWQVSLMITSPDVCTGGDQDAHRHPLPREFPQEMPLPTTTPSLTLSAGNLTPTPLPVPVPAGKRQLVTILRGDPFSFQGVAPSGNVSEVQGLDLRTEFLGSFHRCRTAEPAVRFQAGGRRDIAMIDGKYRILFEIPTSGNSYGMRIASVGKQNDTFLYDPQGIRVLDFGDITENQISGMVAAATVERAIRETGTENVTGITLQVDGPEITIDPIPDSTYRGYSHDRRNDEPAPGNCSTRTDLRGLSPSLRKVPGDCQRFSSRPVAGAVSNGRSRLCPGRAGPIPGPWR